MDPISTSHQKGYPQLRSQSSDRTRPAMLMLPVLVRSDFLFLSSKGCCSTTPTDAANICQWYRLGSETISHIYENGRVTIMFCSFGKLPRIMRLFCKGSVVEWDSPRFEPLLKEMGKERIEGARAVLLLDVWKVSVAFGLGSFCNMQSAVRLSRGVHRLITFCGNHRSKHPAATACPSSHSQTLHLHRSPPTSLSPTKTDLQPTGRGKEISHPYWKIARRWAIGAITKLNRIR